MGETIRNQPNSITSAEYDEAYRRVNAYLAALGVHHEWFRNDQVRQVMERTLAEINSEERPAFVAQAIQEIERESIAWLSRILELTKDEAAEISRRGRLALLLADFPGRWQHLFLTDPPWPDEFVSAMRESYLKAVPHFDFGAMEDRPLDLGYIPHLAEATLLTLEKTRWLRLILIWAGFIGFFSLLFYFSR